jgi:ABC-type hemin transport system ATPase subunit
MSKIYGTGDAVVVALDNMTVEFGRGRLTAIMGPSGSGKVHADALPGESSMLFLATFPTKSASSMPPGGTKSSSFMTVL